MSQNVTRLKELLFDRETATLAEMQQRIVDVAAAEKSSREAQAKSLETALADEAARRALLAEQVEKLMARAGTQGDEFPHAEPAHSALAIRPTDRPATL